MDGKLTLKNKYRIELDGLRGIAVIAVILNHINTNFIPSGYLGVDIFFVISGYVITSSLDQKESTSFREFISSFYARRIKRLLPALVFFVLINSFIICLIRPNAEGALLTGVSSLFGLSNISLFWKAKDYFAISNVLNPFTHTWSLGVEEQFYLIFPFIIWFSGFKNKVKDNIKSLFKLNVIFTTFSLILFIYFYPINQPAAYFLMPSRFWEISIGCLTYLTLKNKNAIFRFFNIFPSSLALFLILGLFFSPKTLAVQSTILVCLFTSVLIICIKDKTFCYKFLTNKKLVFIGIISYSLYLWHWSVITISYLGLGEIYLWSIPFLILLIFCLAFVSFKYIETPFRKSNIINNPKPILLLGSITIIFTSLIINFLLIPNKDLLYTSKFEQKDFLAASRNIRNEYPDAYEKRLNKYKKVIYVFGDSHAYNMFPSIEAVSNKFDFDKVYLRGRNLKELNQLDKYIFKNDLLVLSTSAYNTKFDLEELIIALSKISNKNQTKLILIDSLNSFGKNKEIDFYSKLNFYKNGPTIPRIEAELLRKDHTKILKKYIDNQKIFYFDPLNEVCDEKICNSVINQKLIYADASPHINQNGKYIFKDFWINIFSDVID